MRVWHNLLKSMAAVLIGNTIYFVLLMKHLPLHAQHSVYRIDFGLLLDFWICLAVWGFIELLVRRRKD